MEMNKRTNAWKRTISTRSLLFIKKKNNNNNNNNNNKNANTKSNQQLKRKNQ
jgi:hypothetical protein